MTGEPWANDKHLVVFKRIEEDEAIKEVDFHETSYWVQLHGLPVSKMNHETATILGSLGKIEQITKGDTNTEGGKSMHIRVHVNITKPLCRGRKTIMEKGMKPVSISNTNAFPIFATGVVILSTLTRIVLFGCETKNPYELKTSSLAHGCERQMINLGEKWRSKLMELSGPPTQNTKNSRHHLHTLTLHKKPYHHHTQTHHILIQYIHLLPPSHHHP